MRRAIITAADKVLLEAIIKCFLNICKDTIKISQKTYKKLTPYSNHIEIVADTSKPITQRKRVILQKGDGCLPFLLAPALEKLASQIFGKIMEHVNDWCSFLSMWLILQRKLWSFL